MTYQAAVTRYPTGVFGIAYAGTMFWRTCIDEAEVHKELAALKLTKRQVRWEERYYHKGRYVIPSDYKTRKYYPKS